MKQDRGGWWFVGILVGIGATIGGGQVAEAQTYSPYYYNYRNVYGSPYTGGYGYGYSGGGNRFYQYNAPYSHIYYSPNYTIQRRGSYTVPYYYGGGYHGKYPNRDHSSKPGGTYYPSRFGRNASRGEVPAGTVGWIPAPVSPRSQKVRRGK